MTALWGLPTKLNVGGRWVEIRSDYRTVLEIFSYLNDEALPTYIRWQIALQLFYASDIPEGCSEEAVNAMCDFISGGQETETVSEVPLLSWEQDAAAIIADVNKVAATEIRSLPYLHWWTFLSYFHAIGEGQLSTVVGIRQKLRKGEKLLPWEQSYYREHKRQIDLRKAAAPEEQAQRRQLLEMLQRQDAQRKGGIAHG